MKKLKWTTEVHYVDEETGEILPKHTALANYDLIKTIKETQFNNTTYEASTSGKIIRYNICRTSRQLKLH